MEKLKPCKDCMSEDVSIHFESDHPQVYLYQKGWYQVKCLNCGKESILSRDKQDVIDILNGKESHELDKSEFTEDVWHYTSEGFNVK